MVVTEVGVEAILTEEEELGEAAAEEEASKVVVAISATRKITFPSTPWWLKPHLRMKSW